MPIRHCDKNCQYGGHNFHGMLKLQNIENTLWLFGGACLNIMLYSSLKTSDVTLITVCQVTLWAPSEVLSKEDHFSRVKKQNQRALCRATGLVGDQPLWRWCGKCHLADGILMLTSGACSYQEKPTWETAGECSRASVSQCSNFVGLGIELLNSTQSCQLCQFCGSSSCFFGR